MENLCRALQAIRLKTPEITSAAGRGFNREKHPTIELYPGEASTNGFWTRLNEVTPN